MKIELSQEYKDDLYEKVLEKRKQRTRNKKRLLSIFIVFVSFVGIATFGFSKLSKGDYINFFISKTENIEFNDEYEYYDDLGIKLEFVNKDENSLTIGINLKYEDIKDYKVNLNYIKIKDVNGNNEIIESGISKVDDNKKYFECRDMKYNSNSDMTYFLKYTFDEKTDISKINFEIKEIVISNISVENIFSIDWKKEISIEE